MDWPGEGGGGEMASWREGGRCSVRARARARAHLHTGVLEAGEEVRRKFERHLEYSLGALTQHLCMLQRRREKGRGSVGISHTLHMACLTV